jgi:uncharacterized protein (DUF2252 family)
MNIVKRIQRANLGRDPERLVMKYRLLRDNAFSFFRGTCHLFYDRLAESGFGVDAPSAWCCGDLHLENFGSYKGDNRLVYFDINDFDEAALAPVTWELVRLCSSLHVGLDALGLDKDAAGAAVGRLVGAYGQALVCGKARWIERDAAHGVVRHLLDQLRDRTRVAFLDSRTRLVRRRRRLLVDGRRALAIPAAEREVVAATVHRFGATQGNPEFFRVLDVARRVAGTGSLGVNRYVVLVEGHGSPHGNYLFDLKQALPSSLGRQFAKLQPRWDDEAERVTSIQERMQAVSVAFLQPVVHAGQAFVLRALQPSEDRLPFDHICTERELFDGALDMMGQCLAWAQLRSSGRQQSATADALIAFAGRKKWRSQVAEAAVHMATQMAADWQTYASAYDTGQLAPLRNPQAHAVHE